jgi:hypothetical protein
MNGIEPNAQIREIAAQGIRNLSDVKKLMSALVADVVAGRVSPAAANKLLAKLADDTLNGSSQRANLAKRAEA